MSYTPRIGIVGGGIAGLAAAWSAAETARERAQNLDIVLFEAGPTLGGKAQSLKFAEHGGYLVETGPNGFVDRDPIVRRLAALAGIEDQLVEAQAADKRRYIYSSGLREVGPHPLTLARSGLLSVRGLLRLITEPWQRAMPADPKESLHDFAVRRLGHEAAERLVAPMATGVYAGDTRGLSATAAFPSLSRFEQEHGSLLRGLRAQSRTDRSQGKSPPLLLSFRNGMQSLPNALGATGRFSVRMHCAIDEIRPDRHCYQACWSTPEGDQGTDTVDRIIIASEAPVTTRLLATCAPQASDALKHLSCPGVASLSLLFRRSDLAGFPKGFGVLMRHGQGQRVLGCLFETQAFAHRSAKDTVLLRFLLGGSLDKEALDLDDDELERVAFADLGRWAQVAGPPTVRHISRWRQGIPQLEVGHEDLVHRVNAGLARTPGLSIANSGLFGPAFIDAARAGWDVGAKEAVLALQASNSR